MTASKRKMYIFLFILAAVSAASFQGWRTLLNNFAVDVAGLDGTEIGLIQSVREIPGFLALTVVYVLLVIKEHRLASLSIIILGIGVSLAGFMPSFFGIMFTTLIMSFGFHYYETVNQSLTLQYFDNIEAPVVLGRMRSVNAAANICIGGAIFVAAYFMDYVSMFIMVGVISVAGGAYCFFTDPADKNLPPQRKKMVFRKKYWLFYVLTFLSGARRQIFVTFAVFLMVKKFGYSIQSVTIMFVANNVVNFFLNPMIGRAINKFGERKVLTLEYSSLFFIFLGYAFTESAFVAGVLYILDNIFFNFAIAIRTYFQKIADPADISPSMAMGFTINHIAAVLVPALGGLIWMVDYRTVFVTAAILSLVSLGLGQKTALPDRGGAS